MQHCTVVRAAVLRHVRHLHFALSKSDRPQFAAYYDVAGLSAWIALPGRSETLPEEKIRDVRYRTLEYRSGIQIQSCAAPKGVY